ncbi:OLC1v1001928C1 [Oldenlandia corymbosa var. corymbosa]|uniref:OLC1v1001928C1 n=1 Tax=Oldenlandia corymbosa var. corymbosa TaxID=529605 RepID=A0AAV1D6K3_OLDCO|nr:OLC1v1001928C1 [Oldenlandia corymbosa var. corymbosa]
MIRQRVAAAAHPACSSLLLLATKRVLPWKWTSLLLEAFTKSNAILAHLMDLCLDCDPIIFFELIRSDCLFGGLIRGPDGLEILGKPTEEEKRGGSYNFFVQLMDEARGLDKIKDLQSHENDAIRTKALKIWNPLYREALRVWHFFEVLGDMKQKTSRMVVLDSDTRRFTSEEVSGQNQVKASVQRKIRQSIAEEYPGLEPVLDDLLPKKSPLIVAKCPNHLNLVIVNNTPLFFNIRDGPYMPTLRLLHQYPNIMKKLQVDRGAIKHVLAGANIMCPGLTSPGGALDEEVGAEAPVAIMAEGKQHALAIGFTKMSAKDIKSINKGIGVDNMHYLNDGLWKMEHLD